MMEENHSLTMVLDLPIKGHHQLEEKVEVVVIMAVEGEEDRPAEPSALLEEVCLLTSLLKHASPN